MFLTGFQLSEDGIPPKEMKMTYEKPQLLALHSEIQAAEKCLRAVLEGVPPYLYLSSPNAYESDE